MPSSRFAGFVPVHRYKVSAGHCSFKLLFHRLLGIADGTICSWGLRVAFLSNPDAVVAG